MTKSFQPTFWATACVIPVLIVLVALGTWQVQRLEWKSQLIDNRAARITEPPVPLAVLADVQGGQLDVRVPSPCDRVWGGPRREN